MFDRVKISLTLLALFCAGSPSVYGFTTGGPRQAYQGDNFGYNRYTRQITGTPLGPQNLGEEFRVNVPEVFVAFDGSFLDYFGTKGQQEVMKAIQYFNNLPPYSSMSEDLSEFPVETLRENYRAGALLLTDVKSYTMFMLIQQFGLISPELSIWGVQSRAVQPNLACPFYDFFLIKRNFDPVTWEPSSYVNGALYTYTWLIQCAPAPDFTYVSPVPVDPLGSNFSSVAGGNFDIGIFFNGLTRDDIGGLRYIYRKNNYNMEQLPPNVFAGVGGGGSPWSIVVPPPTNAVVSSVALRGGIDHLTITQKPYDSLLSSFFIGFTNTFNATVATNGTTITESWSRPVLQPDFAFAAGNLAVDVGSGTWNIMGTPTPQYNRVNANNADLNGPGSMDVGNGTATFTFQKIGDTFTASYPSFLSEANLIQPIWRWGSFDGTTNAPVVYPSGVSIQEMENQVFGQ